MQNSQELKLNLEPDEKIVWSADCHFSRETKLIAVGSSSGVFLLFALLDPSLRIVWLVAAVFVVPPLLYFRFRHAGRNTFVLTNQRLVKLYAQKIVDQCPLSKIHKIVERKGINAKVLVYVDDGRISIDPVNGRPEFLRHLIRLTSKESK
jgi:hypothetical protein